MWRGPSAERSGRSTAFWSLRRSIASEPQAFQPAVIRGSARCRYSSGQEAAGSTAPSVKSLAATIPAVRRRSLAVTAAAVVLLSSSPAPAQESDVELLRAILCELKELRAAVRQGQILAPLLDANLREREALQKRLSELEEQQSRTDQAVQLALAKQSRLREQLRQFSRSTANLSDKVPEKELETILEETTAILQQHQSEQNRLASEASGARTRLGQLEDEFDGVQRQVRALATTSGTLCENAAREH